MDINNLDAEAKKYFNNLPAGVQEQIMQLGMEFTTKEDLEAYFENSLRSGS